MKNVVKKILSRFDKKIGYSLIILSIIVWVGIFLIPFIPFNTSFKLTLGTVLVVLGEIFFWSGTVILGKEFIVNLKGKFIRKFRK